MRVDVSSGSRACRGWPSCARAPEPKVMAWFCAVLLVLLAPLLQAHDARPLSLTLLEQGEGVYRTVVRAPPTLELLNAPILHWPAHCEIRESRALALALGSISLVACPGGLAGSSLRVEYPQYNPSLTTMIRLQRANGVALTAVLPPDELSWEVPTAPDAAAIAWQYTVLGFEHILIGLDHLLFVAGLLLLARQRMKIILAITGFTIAHSLTLALVTFEVVYLPVPLVEALIALSIVFLAGEIVRDDPQAFSKRYPVMLSFVFGLLHGFGFAAVLGEISLPTGEMLLGLLFFNIGVELGQLAFIAGCVLLWQLYAWWQAQRVGQPVADWQHASVLRAGAYVIGIPAAYWFVERALGIF